MSQSSSRIADGIPRWLIWVGSLAIIGHLTALGVNALAAPSGPWWDNEGMMIAPPLLAYKANESLGVDYLKPIRLNLNYHVFANHVPATTGVYLEFRLKDEDGNLITKVKVPDDNANAWVHHRQSLLATIFAEDDRIAPPQSEVIAAPGQEVPKKQIWEGDKALTLHTVDINQIPRNRPVSGPSEWMFLFARSYARHLCRLHGAAKAELIRHHQAPIRPFVLTQEVRASEFDEVLSYFGEFSR